jgi:hypothetical protein
MTVVSKRINDFEINAQECWQKVESNSQILRLEHVLHFCDNIDGKILRVFFKMKLAFCS